MNDIQDSGRKTLTIIVKASKLTNEVILNALKDMSENPTKLTGRKTVNQLTGGKEDELKNISVTENNLADFERTARKYGISYCIRKSEQENDVPKYLVQFQGKDLETVQNALQEYAYEKTNNVKSRFSLERIQEISKNIEDINRNRQRTRQKDRGIDR